MNITHQTPVQILCGTAVLLFMFSAPSTAKALRISGTAPDTIAVWIYFTDKPQYSTGSSGTPRSLARRRSAGDYTVGADADKPVNPAYLRAIELRGATLRHCFKWDNAASFNLPAGQLKKIAALPFVTSITPVNSIRKITSAVRRSAIAKQRVDNRPEYGYALDNLAPLYIPQAHEYLAYRFPGSEPGSGVRIALFDSGFRLKHRSFRHLFARNAVIATYDFVDRDTSVADPDSVASSRDHPYFGNDLHGSEVASLFASYDPPYYVGTAWGAQFLLARTEDTYMYDPVLYTEREVHQEEDNWAAAVVWAESLGVDIISSSVGYRTDFEDTVFIDQGNGTIDTLVDYRKSDLDGATTVISRAAREAVRRGVLIVNSAGNEGDRYGDTSLNAPADVDGVIAVGAVYGSGIIASFSSRGPTADGRIKPDLVAPGTGITFPDFYNDESTDSYSSSSGTSFSAPLVAGICALMKQSDPSLDAARLREKLYRSCRFAPNQTRIDNTYGHGIPDALISCMRKGDVILTAADTGNLPLQGAVISAAASGDSLAVTDRNGQCRFRLIPDNTTSFVITKGVHHRNVTLTATPARVTPGPCSLTVTVVDDHQRPIPNSIFNCRIDSIGDTLQSDSGGILTIVSFFQLSVSGIISREGYLPSDSLLVILDEVPQHRTMRLTASVSPALDVFPTVVRRSRGGELHIRLKLPATSGSRKMTVFIRSLTGELLWTSRQNGVFSLIDKVWNCRNRNGSSVAPGTYFVCVACDDRKWRKKILVAP